MKRSRLQRAIELATRFHAGAEDPPGEPYVVHPMRVMLAVSDVADFSQHEALRCVAILHDVLERTDAKPKDLRKAGMSEEIIEAVKLLTHDRNESYAEYVVRLKPNDLARRVKLADLADNHDLRHLPLRLAKHEKDLARPARYLLSYQFLHDQIDDATYRKLMADVEF